MNNAANDSHFLDGVAPSWLNEDTLDSRLKSLKEQGVPVEMLEEFREKIDALMSNFEEVDDVYGINEAFDDGIEEAKDIKSELNPKISRIIGDAANDGDVNPRQHNIDALKDSA